MTLQEWSELTGVDIQKSKDFVFVQQKSSTEIDDLVLLWHLEDFVVSSVSGPVIWLVERIKHE